VLMITRWLCVGRGRNLLGIGLLRIRLLPLRIGLLRVGRSGRGGFSKLHLLRLNRPPFIETDFIRLDRRLVWRRLLGSWLLRRFALCE